MPIVENGKTLNKDEFQILSRMLSDSMDAHIAAAKEAEAEDKPYFEDRKFLTKVQNHYAKAKEDLQQKLQDYMKSEKTVSVSDILENELTAINKDFLQKYPSDKHPTMARHETASFRTSVLGYVPANTDWQKNIMNGTAYKNAHEKFANTAKSFKLTNTPMEGVKKLKSFNPNSDRVVSMNALRAGNSETLSADVSKMKAQLDPNSPEYVKFEPARKQIQQDLLNSQQGAFGFNAAVELSRIKASELMNKPRVNALDLYSAFDELNEKTRGNPDKRNGLRGGFVQAANLIGVSSDTLPGQLHELLSTIADNMNIIKETKDPDLQKSRAIQLAAFTYQMSVAEHVFEDGNGRSCRLLADTILQSFGVPPHIPTLEEKDIANNIGETMDFRKGAEVFMEGIQATNERFLSDKKERTAAPKPSSMINDNVVSFFDSYYQSVKAARGTFKDSKEYTHFAEMVDVSRSMAKTINDSLNAGQDSISLKDLSSNAKLAMTTLFPDAKKNDKIPMDAAKKVFDAIQNGVQQAAQDYVDYKMKTSTPYPDLEPNKKPLNSQDMKKLQVINQILPRKVSHVKQESVQVTKKAKTL